MAPNKGRFWPPVVQWTTTVFRLHWSISSVILLMFSMIITTRQYVGNPISCMHTQVGVFTYSIAVGRAHLFIDYPARIQVWGPTFSSITQVHMLYRLIEVCRVAHLFIDYPTLLDPPSGQYIVELPNIIDSHRLHLFHWLNSVFNDFVNYSLILLNITLIITPFHP